MMKLYKIKIFSDVSFVHLDDDTHLKRFLQRNIGKRHIINGKPFYGGKRVEVTAYDYYDAETGWCKRA